MRIQNTNQQRPIFFKKNILVKGINPDRGGDIGTRAIHLASEFGLTKLTRLNGIGAHLGTNDFLIIDKETSLGSLFVNLQDILNDYYIINVPEKISKYYDTLVDVIAKDKDTIAITYKELKK